ncbi:MAG: hypothetical protein GQ574_06075 [Crocinitomix sp.]|nr:hypothetical protein [Crocinitomix sp.]
MKTSIKLLLGLLLVIMGGLFYVKYDLKQQYKSLDTSDPYFGFEKTEGLQFSHIKIEGGNNSHLYIEPAATNRLLIEKGLLSDVSYSVVNDTLMINYSPTQTQNGDGTGNYWGTRERSSVIIEYATVESIVASNASIGMEMNGQKQFKTQLFGASNLELFTQQKTLEALSIEAHNDSKHRINNKDGVMNLVFLNVALTDQSMAELYRISFDSSAIRLDSTSRLSADANFFKK